MPPAGPLDPPVQVAQPPLRGPLVRLPRIVGEAARDVEEGKPARDGFLARVLAFVLVAEQDPRLEPRPRVVAESRAGDLGSHFVGSTFHDIRNAGRIESVPAH